MPPVRGCPVTLRHGWEQFHTRVSTTCVRNNLIMSHTWPHHCLPGVAQARTMRCISTASSPERRARGPRVGRASRSPCAEVSISSSANGRRILAAGH
jgi:hypothetical protein